MAHLYRITQKGQVTIPAKLRRKFGIAPHTFVTFSQDKQAITVAPARGILSLAGKGKQGVPKHLLGLPWKEVRERAWEAAARDAVGRAR